MFKYTANGILLSQAQQMQKKYQSKAQKREERSKEQHKLTQTITGLATNLISSQQKEETDAKYAKDIRNELKNAIDDIETNEMKSDSDGQFEKADFRKLRIALYKHERLKQQKLEPVDIFIQLLKIADLL